MTTMLGQFNIGGGGADIPPLAAAPWWQVWTLESPWALAAGLIAGGVAGWWWFNQRSQSRRGIMAIGAGVGLAIAVVVLASLVTTTRERLRGRTKELVGAVARAELDRLGELLAADVVLTARGESLVIGREGLIEAVEATTGSAYPIKTAALIKEEQQADERNFGFTQVWLRLEGTSPELFGRCWWKIGWRREAEGSSEVWRATSIDILQVDFLDNPAALKGVLGRTGGALGGP